MSIEHTIRQEVGLVLAMSSADIIADKPLVEYGLDSVRAMEIIAGLEDLFDLEIADTDVATLHTLADLISYVATQQPEVSA